MFAIAPPAEPHDENCPVIWPGTEVRSIQPLVLFFCFLKFSITYWCINKILLYENHPKKPKKPQNEMLIIANSTQTSPVLFHYWPVPLFFFVVSFPWNFVIWQLKTKIICRSHADMEQRYKAKQRRRIKMMPNATVETKGEAGQIFRLVGPLGSAWHPSLQSLFGGGGAGVPAFSKNQHSPCQLLSFWSFSSSLILTSPLRILVFPLNTSSPSMRPFYAPAAAPALCQNQKKKEKWALHV